MDEWNLDGYEPFKLYHERVWFENIVTPHIWICMNNYNRIWKAKSSSQFPYKFGLELHDDETIIFNPIKIEEKRKEDRILQTKASK